MAFRSEVINQVKRGVFLALLFFLLTTNSAFAAPPSAPILGATDWRTGELEIAWSNVVPGNTIILYTRTWKDTTFTVWDSWTADTSSGSKIAKYYENGQTIWHYIVQVDAVTGETSPASNEGKQTPPITAFIINWPDMFKNMTDFFNQLNQNLKDHLDGLATPSQGAMDGLKDAINGLKDALGAGQAGNTGDSLKNGFDGGQPGMKPPMVVDDGNGTYTGGSGGLTLPNSKSADNLGLMVPNLDEGTNTELTMRIPIGVKMDGSFIYIKLFTQEQMDKMKWLGLLRTLAAAALWILFGMWLVYRFSPQLKS